MTLFSKAWRKAASVEIAQNGFCGTGVYPVNKDAVNVEVYEPNKTTERAQQPADPENPVGQQHSGHQLLRHQQHSGQARKNPEKQKSKESISSGGKDVCRVCKRRYGDRNDLKKTEDWIICITWELCFHESYGEEI